MKKLYTHARLFMHAFEICKQFIDGELRGDKAVDHRLTAALFCLMRNSWAPKTKISKILTQRYICLSIIKLVYIF